MAQYPLLWIERRNYPSFKQIEGLGFDRITQDGESITSV